jgi:hypothetical protein
VSIRSDLLSVVDDLRGIPSSSDFDLRRYRVVLRTRTWPGGQPGLGTPTDVDMEILPRPKVRPLSPQEIASSGGTFQQGDWMVDKITPDYGTGGYTPGAIHIRPGANNQDVAVLLIGDEGTIECDAVKFWHDRAFTYRMVVRTNRTTSG